MNVEVIRSKRRTRTISAVIRGDTLVVTIPARLSAAQEREWVKRMMDRVERARHKASRNRDDELFARAQRLNMRYFDRRLTTTRAASLSEVAWAFTRIGLLSFGGGSASQLLMRKELVWKKGWLTDVEYNHIWQLSKLAVGIQQIGQVILYGRQLCGRKGIAVA